MGGRRGAAAKTPGAQRRFRFGGRPAPLSALARFEPFGPERESQSARSGRPLLFARQSDYNPCFANGEVDEWLKSHAWKACKGV